MLRELPELDLQYRAVRVLRSNSPVPNAPAELGDRLAPTVYGLVHCGWPGAEKLVKAFLTSVAIGYQRQLRLLPDPMRGETRHIG